MRYFLIILSLFSFSFTATLLVPDEYSTIQSAIDVSNNGDTVLVSEGTYSPSINGELFPINMVSGIHLIGSDENLTIIDAEQTDRVITMENCNNNTISKLTLTGGLSDTYGGGIRLDYSDPILTHVTISNNIANWGGGMHSCYSDPTLTYVTISNNQASQGGGMRIIESDLILTNVTISNNIGSEGGGMRIFDSNPILTYVNILNNTALYYGGGMWLDYSDPTLTYVTISNNTADYYGGGIRLSNSNPILTNVTIANNKTNNEGGGMYLNSSSPIIKNSIIWDNIPESLYISSGTPFITYSDIEGGWEDEGNINDNPLFFDSENRDFTLESTSPCIDAGDPNSELDPDGTIVDMGAYYYNQELLLGDINEDLILNIQDIIIMISYILNNEYIIYGDLNQDGVLNIQDIVLILDIILGN